MATPIRITNRDRAEWLVDQLLDFSIKSIDARFCPGYAIKNPDLVGTVLKLTSETLNQYDREDQLEELEELEKVGDVTEKPLISVKQKRPSFKFATYKIPVGAELVSTLNPHIKCTVADGGNSVIYNGDKTSMSAIVNSLKGGSNRGPKYWTYKGKLLSDLHDNN